MKTNITDFLNENYHVSDFDFSTKLKDREVDIYIMASKKDSMEFEYSDSDIENKEAIINWSLVLDFLGSEGINVGVEIKNVVLSFDKLYYDEDGEEVMSEPHTMEIESDKCDIEFEIKYGDDDDSKSLQYMPKNASYEKGKVEVTFS